MDSRMRGSAIALAVVVVALLAFRLGQRRGAAPDSGESPRQVQTKAPRGWGTHEDPAGFVVQIPIGWSASGDRSSGRVEASGPEGQAVFIWPLFVPGALDPSSAPAVLQAVAAKLVPQAQWEPARASSSSARAHGRDGDREAVAVLTWAVSPKGSAVFAYVTAAPAARYRDEEETFARILGSFRVAGAPVEEAAAAAPSFVPWRDPRESAFTIEVPSGWRVQGGLFRAASVDTRPAIEMVSPDGEIRVTGGDPELPPFTEPTPMLQMTGFTEGSWYSPGYGVNMMVRRYATGLAFAREYVAGKVAAGCADLVFVDARDRPDVAQAINSIYGRFAGGITMRMTTGEVAFTCARGGRPMSGYYFAGTLLTTVPGTGALWHVEMLHGYLAPSDRVAEAQTVLDHGLRTFRFDPSWWSMQQNLTGQTSRIVSETNEQITQGISDSYWNRQGVMDEISRRRSNAILGVEDVVDPVDGREIKVESGSNYYWIDHRGTIVGTDTYTKPDIDFRELIGLP